MGLIRFLLAASVVALHIGPMFGLKMIGGLIAVQSFYMISGFYMGMVLNEKYIKQPILKFYTNRWLKIYPIYLTTFLTTLLLGIIGRYIFSRDAILDNYSKLDMFDIKGQLLIVFTNLMIVGQDLLFYIGYNLENKTYFLETDYTISNNPLHHYLLVSQAWTLSLELMFYLIAPLLSKLKTFKLAIIIFLSFLFRFIAILNGFSHKPWDYQFFPFEIAFFCLGIIAYKIFKKKNELFNNKRLSIILAILLSIIIIFQQYFDINKWIFYILFFFSLPFIFQASKNNKIDRYLGELSYPIYMTHILAAIIIYPFINISFLNGFLVLIGSVLISIFLNNFIQKPIEKYRQSRIK